MEICGRKFETVEEDDVQCIEMEPMAGIEVGTSAMEVHEENAYSKMEVSASTKLKQHKSKKEENQKEKGISQGDALLASLQNLKKERVNAQQRQIESLIRQ